MNDLFALLKKYNCIDIRIRVIGSITMEVVGEYDDGEVFLKPFPFSDFVYIDDFPTLMDALNEFALSNKSRMYTHFRLEFENELHWAYMCCSKEDDCFKGVLLDVYEYLDCIPNDSVINEFEQRQGMKISELNKNGASLEEICGAGYLAKVQKPFLDDKSIVSVIFDDDRRIISSTKENISVSDLNSFKYSISEPIRFNYKIGGYWNIYSDDKKVKELGAFLTSMAESLSKIAHSLITLYNEMENSRAVNRQLGANVEQQMLINSMQSVIMEETSAHNAISRVLDMVGKYLNLGKIIAFSEGEERCNWTNNTLKSAITDEVIREDKDKILKALESSENYFSVEKDKDMEEIGITAFAISRIIDNNGDNGFIFYGVYDEEKKWSYNDRKIIRNVSQVLSSMIFRCKMDKEIELKNRQLYKLAFYDSMLEIKNRTKLDDDIAAYLKNNENGAVMAVQVLNTRFLNEVFGQKYTDKVLQSIAEYFTKDTSAGDSVYRYSGSIFMLVLRGFSAEEAQALAHKIIERFSLPFVVDNVEQFAEAAIGIATYGDATDNTDNLYREATLSLYRANEYGKNTYAFYNQEFLDARGTANSLEIELRKCIGDNMKNFVVTYQPIYDISGSIIHYEALLRWKSEEYGYVSPKIFMRLMEKVGLDASIDLWVIPKACDFCRKVREITGKDLKVSVNLTTHEMQTGAFPASVQNILSKHELPAEALIVEVPEAAHVTSYNSTASTLGKLKKLGVNVCIDGFGYEFLPLNILKNSYIDMIKTGVSFITNSGENFDSVILNTTLSLAKMKGIMVGVKNIEHEGQYKAALNSNVSFVQGGYFSTPKTEEEIIEQLTAEKEVVGQ